MVELLDENGEKLTRFRTKEEYAFIPSLEYYNSTGANEFSDMNRISQAEWQKMCNKTDADQEPWPGVLILRPKGNRLTYGVNVRDLRDTSKVKVSTHGSSRHSGAYWEFSEFRDIGNPPKVFDARQPMSATDVGPSRGDEQATQVAQADVNTKRLRDHYGLLIDDMKNPASENAATVNATSPVASIAHFRVDDSLAPSFDNPVEVVFTPDGGRALAKHGISRASINGGHSAGWRRIVRLWDIATQKVIASTLVGYDNVLSPHARYVFCNGNGRDYELWDSQEAGGDLLKLQIPKGGRGYWEDVPDDFALFSPSGNYVMVRYRNETVAVWNLATMKEMHRYPGYHRGAFLPGEKLLLAKSKPSISSQVELDVLNLEGEVLRTFSLVPTDQDVNENQWTLSGDQSRLVSFCLIQDKRQRLARSVLVQAFNIESGKKLNEFALSAPLESERAGTAATVLRSGLERVLDVSPDGSLLRVNAITGDMEVWDISHGRILSRVNADRCSVFTSGNDLVELVHGSLVLWDTKTGELVAEYKNVAGIGYSFGGLLRDGKRAFVTGNNGFTLITVPDWNAVKAARKLAFEGFSLLHRLDHFRETFPDAEERSTAQERALELTSLATEDKSKGWKLSCEFFEGRPWQMKYTRDGNASQIEAAIKERLGPPSLAPKSKGGRQTQMAWDFPGVVRHVELIVDSDGRGTVIITRPVLRAMASTIVSDAIAASRPSNSHSRRVEIYKIGYRLGSQRATKLLTSLKNMEEEDERREWLKTCSELLKQARFKRDKWTVVDDDFRKKDEFHEDAGFVAGVVAKFREEGYEMTAGN